MSETIKRKARSRHAGKNQNSNFAEDPIDIETLFESLEIASDAGQGVSLLFMSKIINGIRLNPEADITALSFKTLQDLGILAYNENN